ncbi:MAG: Rrf2 family transcriptional regulator [Hespellia sp.]|nr:Rrf2 family transcriptional regulator [Hespellia sp.]
MTSEFSIAVHTLVFLNHKQDCQTSERIAENVCTNPARIRKILSKLKKAGFIATKEGIDGGCHFVAEPGAITLEMIACALGETPVHVSKRTGSLDMDCQIASGMGGVMDDIYEQLNQACFKKLSEMTIADIDAMIFPDAP